MKNSVQSASDLEPLILEFRPETEKERRLPKPVVSALRKHNLFRLFVPEGLGGAEIDPVDALRTYEALAVADASVAWCVWNSALPCMFGRYLKEKVRKDIFGSDTAAFASSSRPTGEAHEQGDAFRVSGRWTMVSGCQHADWIGLMCVVMENGVPRKTDMGPELRLAFVKKGDFEIRDTWFVSGLRGTGSHDVLVENLDIPREYTFTPLDPVQLDRPIARLPISATMSSGHAAICLGIAQASLDVVLTLGRSKVTVDPVPRLPDRAVNQYEVSVAKTKIKALRTHLHNVTDELWSWCRNEQVVGTDDLAGVWSAAVHTARECRSVVNSMCEVAGGPAIYENFALERYQRDINAALQHVIVQRLWLEQTGRVMFGMEPTNPLFSL